MTHRSLYALTPLVALALLFTVAPARDTAYAQQERCFPETGFCIAGRLRQYWEQNGGLPVFGYPITAQQAENVEGSIVQVQWFERNRLELHPENQPPYDVLLGRLGVDYLEQHGRNWFEFPKSQPRAGCRFFAETGHNVCGEFLTYWRNNGLEIDGRPGQSEAESLALFGLPLSDEQRETFNGQEYTVQWFERARFEFHPENQPPFNVLLGLLGNEVRSSGGQPATPAAPDTSAGQLAFTSVREGNQDVYVMNTDGSRQRRLMNIPEDDGQPTWSPDGAQLAFETNRDGNWEVYRVNISGAVELTRLTNTPPNQDSGAPAWFRTASGWQIAFHSNRDGNWEIYTMSSDQGQGVRNLTNHPTDDEDPVVSPDGTRVAFTSKRDGNQSIYVMDLDGAGIIRLTTDAAPDGKPAWSPDGQRIAFETRRDGNWEVYVINVDGTGILNLTQNSADDGYPTWSPDGRQIAFQSNRDGNWNIYVLDVDRPGAARQLTSDPAADLHPAWQPAP